jgi:hypothetical protein
VFPFRAGQPCLRFAVVLGLLLAARAGAAPPAGDVDVSPAFQPEGFSGAVGTSFKMEARAKPTELHLGERLTLTLRVTAARGKWQRPPHRLDLAALPQFKRQFTMDPHPSSAPDREPAEGVWEFDYVLRPRTTEVREVPSIAFRYYNPRITREDRSYATTWAHTIPLKVLPPGILADVPPVRLPAAPDRFYEIATGPGLLRHDEPFSPSWRWTVVLVVLPPALCLGWYAARRRLDPDAARSARRVQSLAAGQALRALRAAKAKGAAPADAVGIVTRYLQQRTDLSASEPTPAEVRAHLQSAGTPSELAVRAAELFRAADLARFGPQPESSGSDLMTRATALILALEGPGENALGVPAGVALIFLLTVAAPLLAAATALSPQDLLDRAVTAFSDGAQRRHNSEAALSFHEAAQAFDALQQQGAQNADLCRGQGNARLLANDLPGAILAYRRGLLLEANDRGLRANLAYARDLVRYSSEDGFGRPPVDRWPPWLPRLTAGTCWRGLWLAYGVFCLACTRWWLTRQGWLWGTMLTALALTLALATGLVIEVHKGRWEAVHPAVVVAADIVPLRQGNGTAYPWRSDSLLHAGVEARLRYVRGDWVQVELSRGEVGWLPRSAVLLDGSD